MYHFIFIDEASSENEQGNVVKQETKPVKTLIIDGQKPTSLSKDIHFLLKDIQEEDARNKAKAN
jgi:hypothetical protein